MNFILCIISYFLIGFIIGIMICKIKGKEWCKDNGFDLSGIDNNAQGVIYVLTFFWGFIVSGIILFSPFLIIHYIIIYTSNKLQK